MRSKQLFTLVFFLFIAGPILKAEETSIKDNFGFELGLGTISLLTNPALPVSETNNFSPWQMLALKPDFKIAKFGIGLDLSFHFNFDFGEGGEGFVFYEPDWVPEKAGLSFLELYLPKIQYLSWGAKGEDLYVKFGSFDDASLGNGFIMGNYRNTSFLPGKRIFGAALNIDGQMINFPWLGMETFIGNLARFDVLGARLFARPLVASRRTIFTALQIGASFGADRSPFIYDNDPDNDLEGEVLIYGFDFRMPITYNPILSMALLGDFVLQGATPYWGSMLGFEGRIVSAITYAAQARLMGPNFVPNYFDAQYDLFRHEKYLALTNPHTNENIRTGWLASLGTNVFSDGIVLIATLEGLFNAPPAIEASMTDFPHLRMIFRLQEGILSGFSIDAYWDKYYLGAPEEFGGKGDFFSDLFSPENAVIGIGLHYKTGPAVLTMAYNLRYDPSDPDSTRGFVVSSSLYSSIKF